MFKHRLVSYFRGDSLRTSLAKASAASLVLKAINAGLGFATTVVLARMLGPDSLGVYAFAMAAIMVIGLPCKAGVPQLVTRETAKGQASKDWSTVKGVWRWGTGVVIAISVLLMVVGVLAGALFPGYLATEQGLSMAWGFLMIPLMGLALVRAAALRGLGHTVQGQLPELAIKPLAFLALLSTVWLWKSNGPMPAFYAIALEVTATGIAFMVGAVLLWRARPRALMDAEAGYESRAWLATLIPMAMINAMHLINTQVDILLIGFFMEGPDTGHYKVAAQTSLIVAFGLQATKMVVEPQFSRLYHMGEMEKLQRVARAASRLNLTIAGVVLLLLLVWGKDFLVIAFGSLFVAAYTPMLILSVARMAGASIGSSGHLLIMSGHHKQYARFWILAAVLNVIGNLVLIPLIGTTGAALSTAITLTLANGLGWWGAKKWIGCDCSPFG